MAALNYQNFDKAMILSFGKFSENGGINCGYVLKPQSTEGNEIKIELQVIWNNFIRF